MSIPASEIVQITPSVLSAGGNPLALNGLVLTESATLPIGEPYSFPTAAAVSTYFGPSSTEAEVAAIYFNGFQGSTQKPGALLMSRYASTAGSAFLRGAESNLNLAQIQAITAGSLVVTVDGVVATCSTVNLSTSTSPSDAAAKITTAFTGTSKPVVSYDATFGAFVLTSQTTGVGSTIAYPISGSLATSLNLTSVSGAILSQGADPTTAAAHMNAIIAANQNWVMFMTTWEPSFGDTNSPPDPGSKELFADWADAQNGRYIYAAWDTDAAAITTTPGTTFGEWLAANSMGSTAVCYNSYQIAAFELGTTASIDFNAKNGRIAYAFRRGTGVTASVTDVTAAQNLLANGYSFYGTYATANDSFTWLYDGQVSGDYKFIDSQVNAIWMNNQFQLAIMGLYANSNSIPYNNLGYGMITAAVQDPINQALNFGAIQTGVPLSSAQIAEVNTQAGVKIDQDLYNKGYYFQILPATAQVRALRQSPPCHFWYMDGESVQKLDIASTVVL